MSNLTSFLPWVGTAVLNGMEYDSVGEIPELSGKFHLVLNPAKTAPAVTQPVPEATQPINLVREKTGEKRITVKKYMTQKSTPSFDFMAHWNHDNPMPMRVMVGTKVKETSGMVYMILHGDITEQVTSICMKCGKPITNPVSRYFGLGPICGGHNYVNPFQTAEELEEAVKSYREQLRHMVWEGWIIKSAITEEVDV